jgi:hypothetical protein
MNRTPRQMSPIARHSAANKLQAARELLGAPPKKVREPTLIRWPIELLPTEFTDEELRTLPEFLR